MPAWKGWNEVDVRQSQNGDQTTRLSHMSSTTLIPDASSSTRGMDSAIPVTMGFTAINAPNPDGQRVSGTASTSKQEHKGPSAKQDNDGGRQTRLMVAEYLGRGEVEIAPPTAPRPTRVTRGSEAKKKITASKKRAATTNEQSTSKRRKSSTVADSMPMAKLASSNAKGKGKSSNGQAASTLADVAEDIPSQPVALFSSSTSMETLAVSSQKTSMDAVKTSQGFGTILYRGPQSTAGVQATCTVAQPWLDRKTAKSRHARSSGKPPDTGRGGGVPKNANVGSVQVHQPGEPSTGDVESSRTVEDDFAIGEEEGFEEVMALADSLEARRKPHKDAQHPAGRRNTSQTQKTKPERKSSSAVSSYRSVPVVQPPTTLSESFIIGGDEDMDEAMALLENHTETSALSRDKQASQSLKRKQSSGTVKDQATGRRKSTLAKESSHGTGQALSLEENFILAEDDDEAVIENITRATEETARRRSPTPPTRQWKLNMREVDEDEDYGGALFSEAERQILDSIKASQQNSIKPIVRPAFPRPILDRSPLFGASSATTLRTCFRIGEAVKEGSMSVRMNSNVIIELYARVVYSHREGRKQHFVFHDLYHDRQPYLEGTRELWDQTKLRELDTRSFLGAERDGEGVICRAVAKMKRKEGAAGKGWRLDVLSIWEARWEDVDFVAGIYCKDRNADDEEE